MDYEKRYKKYTVEEFLKENPVTYECELIITPEGLIKYALPGHVYALANEMGVNYEEYGWNIPLTELPIQHMVRVSRCVSVWPDGFLTPADITNEQYEALKALISAKLIDNNKMKINY